MSDFLNNVKVRAKESVKTIVLPEGDDPRTLEAAKKIDFAEVTVLQKSDDFPKKEEYAKMLFELRKSKGLTIDKAHELMEDPLYYANMMVKNGDADGMVAGATHTTSDVLRPALQIIKTNPNTSLVSAFFFIVVDNKPYVFSDCGLNPNPSAEELAEIAVASAKTYETFTGESAKVAMLSYSTYGSAKGELVEKVQIATKLAKDKAPNMYIDGELQLDAAIIPEIAKMKASESSVAGQANVLIFPDLQSGNIGYKLVERFAKAEAYGPIMQGIAKPVNDLSRGCTADDIVGVAAITCVQAQDA